MRDEQSIGQRLEAAFHKCWTAQRGPYDAHAYNKAAFQEFQEVVNEAVRELRGAGHGPILDHGAYQVEMPTTPSAPTLMQRLRALYLVQDNVLDGETLKETITALSHGAATDSVPLGTISECPSCGGDGKLTTTPGQFGPCWRCGGSGRVMAYREEKEQFDAKMQKIGAFVAACNGEQPSSTRQSDVLVGRTQTALRRFDDNVDMGDPESVAAWWNKHGAPLLDTIDKAASSPASAIGAWITVEQMKADGTIYAIDISPEPPCLIQWKDGAWRFMGGMRCATVLEGVKRALQVMAPTDGRGDAK